MQPTTQARTAVDQALEASQKTSVQRKDELFTILGTSNLLAPDNIIKTSDAIAGKVIAIGGKNVLEIPDSVPRAWQSKSGKRAGETSYTLFDNRYDPIILAGVDGVRIFVRMSITAY